MKPRQKDETADSYIRRLEDSNAALRAQGKWAERASRAVTWLATDASTAFQAMAEKAGVRSHPSVTAAVKMFDTIAHPQWTDDDAVFDVPEFPTDWDIDPPGAWSGDADMVLNSGIADVLEYLENRYFDSDVKKDELDRISALKSGLEKHLQGIVEGALERQPRDPIAIDRNATRDDLAESIHDISSWALDLAQDMASTNDILRRDLRAASYRRIAAKLYELASLRLPHVENDSGTGGMPF